MAFLSLWLFAAQILCAHAKYLLGVGKADITGPAADVNLMGYANAGQLAGGIHTRLYARAYLVADPDDNSKRFIFVNTDACMAAQGVTLGVFEKLKALYEGLYTEQNVAISGIHTHSGPGGYLQFVLYDITSLGFVPQSYDALVYGILESIDRAHNSLKSGSLEFAYGELLGANINRSPTSYLKNTVEERALYKHDVDKEMTLLKIIDEEDDRGRGSVAWFPVHCTSINNTNTLISGDNKGVAAQLMEKWASSAKSNVSDGDFVGAFAQANVGDTSPNTQGAFCLDTGKPCSADQSLCNGRNEMCIGRGPEWDADDHGYKSNIVIATKQFERAQSLWSADSTLVEGGISYRHKFVDMTKLVVEESNFTKAGKTCPAAMGFSFAAGTTDGPGAFDFKQGDTKGGFFWRAVGQFLAKPNQAQIDCQAPKPILLDTGEATLPYAWQPSIVDVQILRVGQLAILCVPGEMTTMAGRRLRHAVAAKVGDAWGKGLRVVIAGLTNTYSSYITTREEYGAQRYEGASTIYGPSTLDAYIQEFRKLAGEMMDNVPVEIGPLPANLISKQLSLLPGIVLDFAPPGSRFGSVRKDVAKKSFEVGETVSVEFQSACPRNNLRTGDTFLTIERWSEDNGNWEVVLTDNDISTKFYWGRPFMLSPTSEATITWEIPEGTPDGTYRIQHFGDNKQIFGGTGSFKGTSGTFTVGKAAMSTGGRMTSLVIDLWNRMSINVMGY